MLLLLLKQRTSGRENWMQVAAGKKAVARQDTAEEITVVGQIQAKRSGTRRQMSHQASAKDQSEHHPHLH